MADIADQADIQNEAALTAAMQYRKPAGPVPNGRCHNCAAPLAEGLPYCDADCRDDHQERVAAARRRGAAFDGND